MEAILGRSDYKSILLGFAFFLYLVLRILLKVLSVGRV